MVAQLKLFDELADPPVPAAFGRATVGIRERSSVLAKANAQYLGCDYTLNPYVGCGFGCSYCYAAFYVADEQKRRDWGNWVDVKTDAERQVSKTELRGKKILMSSATDPYQPLETQVCLTRRNVELLSDPHNQPRLRVQTRSPLAARDIDLFRRFRSIRVNMSITTDCDDIRKRFEPACASIEQRMEALARIGAAGIPIGISISPMLPIRDPDAFGRRLAALQPSMAFSAWFHHSGRDFRASTREPARHLADEYGWNEDRYWNTVGLLRRHLPGLKA